MKTPDETKKGLECCGGDCFNGNEECPYDKDDLKENISCIRWMSKDALAYIQQLEAQVPKWISVKERLPDEGEKVLVWHPDRTVRISTFRFGRWWDRRGYYIGFRVIYWMPLPEQPKEDDHVQK